MWTPHFTFCSGRVCILINSHTLKPWNVNTPLFHKADKFFSPSSTWTVQYSLDNGDVCMPLMQGWLPLLNKSISGPCNCMGTHSTSLFLASVQQGRALECMPWQVKIYWKPPKYKCLSTFQTCGGGLYVSGLEGFHSIPWEYKTQWSW